MANKVLVAFVAIDAIFVAMGALMLGFCVIVRQTAFLPPTEGQEAARDLIYQLFPFNAGIANGVFTFVCGLVTLPALVTGSRSWLKVAGYLVVIDALFTMIIGLHLWILTLKMSDEFSKIWNAQTPGVQDLMQTSFECCGYLNSSSPAFVTDATCPSPAAAALMRGCSTPLTSFGNEWVDNFFTGVFGMVGIQTVLVMAAAALSKDRKERERFRHIDIKRGARGGF